MKVIICPFLIRDDELLKKYDEKYNKICNKVSNSIKKRFDSKLVYNNKYLKTKVKSYEGKINTIFHDYGMTEDDFHYIFLSVILIDSVFEIGKNYYP